MVECLPHRSGEALQGPVLGALKQRQHNTNLGTLGVGEAGRQLGLEERILLNLEAQR